MDVTDVLAMGAVVVMLLRCECDEKLARLDDMLGEALMMLSVSDEWLRSNGCNLRPNGPALELLAGDVAGMKRSEFPVNMVGKLLLCPSAIAAAGISLVARCDEYEYGGPLGMATGSLVADSGIARLPQAGTLPIVSGIDSTRFL